MSLRIARITLAVLLALEIALIVFGPQPKDHLPDIAAAQAAGKRPDWWDDAAMGVRYAAWINLGLLALLLATSKCWTRPLSHALPNQEPRTKNQEPSFRKWFWPLVVTAAIVCLGLRLPLASKSLWWDEAWVILQASHGKWTPDKKHEGDLKFLAHDWKRCAWYYQKPTNHAPMSLMQKASLNAWRMVHGAKRDEFSDLAARVPALLASIAAVVLLACLLRAWGKPGAGVAAAFVLALHPWHIRYGVDARAYALVVPLCISGMFAVTRLWETRGRKLGPWFWWGLTEFLWMWAFPNGMLDVVALNLVAAVLLWGSQVERRDRWTTISRLLVTNVFAAMLFVQVFLPNLMQARRWAGQESDKHVLSLPLAAETVSLLLLGRVTENPKWHWPLMLGSFTLIAMAVVILAAKHRSLHRAAATLPALAIAAALFTMILWAFDSYYYPRFVIALLPVLIAGFSLALAELKSPLRLAFFLSAFLWSWTTPIAKLLDRPIAPLHDVASFVQNASTENIKSPIVACYGLGREAIPVYEPHCVPLDSRADLENVMLRARAEKRRLLVIQGYDGFNRAMRPDGFALLDDKSLFEEMKSFDGLEPDFRFHVRNMK